MAGRRCPACERGNALSTHKDDLGIVKTCRYCGFERSVMWGKVTESWPSK